MTIFEPASAVAASRCMAARIRDPKRWLTDSHPSACGWCIYPMAALDEMVRGFNDWSGFSVRANSYERHDARVFAELSQAKQQALIVAAQVLEDGLPPAPGNVQPEPVSSTELTDDEAAALL